MNNLSIHGTVQKINSYSDNMSIIFIEVPRKSGYIDVVPFKVRNELITEIETGDFVAVFGKVNTQNITVNKIKHVLVFGYADIIIKNNQHIFVNEFHGLGKLCTIQPIKRASKNRLVLNCVLSIPRNNSQYNYIPVVFWGKQAELINLYDLWAEIEIYGRFQTRKYFSKKENTEKTVYEISVSKIGGQ